MKLSAPMNRAALFAAMLAAICFTGTNLAAAGEDNPELAADVRCVIIAFDMANAQDATAKLSGTIASMYFLGRIDALAPNYDLESHFLEQGPAMTADMVVTERKRCGEILILRGKTLKDMGQDMIQKGQRKQEEESQEKHS